MEHFCFKIYITIFLKNEMLKTKQNHFSIFVAGKTKRINYLQCSKADPYLLNKAMPASLFQVPFTPHTQHPSLT